MRQLKDWKPRFFAKVDKTDGCWLWTAGKFPNGYGKFRHEGKFKKAHRVSFEHHVGPIPLGMLICHRCDVRRCVNPDHLFVGTQKQNIQDAMAKGRFWPVHYRKTHCRHGHEYTTENTYVFRNHWGCRICRRGNVQRYNQRKGVSTNGNKENEKAGQEKGREEDQREKEVTRKA